MAGQQALGIYLCPSTLGYKFPQPYLAFYVSAGDVNSNSQPTEPCLQSLYSSLYEWFITNLYNISVCIYLYIYFINYNFNEDEQWSKI